MPFDVTETTLPGVGRRYEVDLDETRSVAITLEPSGQRQVFYREHADADYERITTLTDSQARTIGLFLVGAYYQPVAGSLPEETRSGQHIEWYSVAADGPAVGMTLADLDIDGIEGTHLLGIEQNGTVDSSPAPETTLSAGDRLIIIATPDAHGTIEDKLSDD